MATFFQRQFSRIISNLEGTSGIYLYFNTYFIYKLVPRSATILTYFNNFNIDVRNLILTLNLSVYLSVYLLARTRRHTIKYGDVRFQFLTAASMKMTAFWDIAPCSLV
jgi:hypothetical protein